MIAEEQILTLVLEGKLQKPVDWDLLLYENKHEFPEKLLKKYINNFNLFVIVITQNLSMEFINKFKNDFDKETWDYLFLCQNLSYDFLMEHIHKVKINNLKKNKLIDEDIKKIVIKFAKMLQNQ